MKRIVSLALVLVLTMTCVLAFASCGMERKIAGTYEMTSISGTITQNGVTTELNEGLYEYYRLILDKDGTVKIEAKGSDTGVQMEEEGTWEWDKEDEVLKIKTKPEGSPVSVTEEMEWEDDTITYTVNQSAQGVTFTFTLVLEKVEK